MANTPPSGHSPVALTRPDLSIIMPAYNSERTIEIALRSVEQQTYRDRVEVLVIDGGSTDRTKEIAERFRCRIIENPRTQPEYAKLIGLAQARGRYAVFLDSDEALPDERSLEHKVRLLSAHTDVKNIITAGLVNPPGYPLIGEYTNRFGEPFSYFMYRLDGGDYVRSLKARYKVSYEDETVVIVEFSDDDVLPICDGGGHGFDLEFLKRISDTSSEGIVPVIFQTMAQETRKLAVIKNDYTLHYSTADLNTYLRKLRWRIVTNVHRLTGTEGFVNRQKYSPARLGMRKYLFVGYALTFIGPLIDAVRLALITRKPFFLVHFPLAVYTGYCIAWQYVLKSIRMTPHLRTYGQ